ncbi:MAG: radical SAM protein [Bacteroidales bacterium]|nr:radical SAM protein [Bacteroidales bacterium]
MIKRILLIDADLFGDTFCSSIYFTHHPIGLLYLASFAKQKFPSIEFRVFHTVTSKDPLQSIESILSTFKPDMVGIRSLSFAKVAFKLVADKIRQLRPDIPILGGGAYPSTAYGDILTDGQIDIAVIGEGEETFVEIINHFSESKKNPVDIKGTAVLENGKVKVNPLRPYIQNLDTIPFPDYSFVNLKDYVGIKNQALSDDSKCVFIMGTRGCPYDCFFCHQLFGRRIRRRSAENIVAEMRVHVEKTNVNNFVFVDDTFNVPMKEAKETLALIIKELPQVKLNFPNGLRADHIDEEMLDLFDKAGTVEIALAVETAIPRLQKFIGKYMDIKKAEIAIHAASKRFVTRTLFMVGFPTETYEEAMETIKFAESFEYVAQPMLSVLRIYNNSKVFDFLNPTEEQYKAISEQEKNLFHLGMFENIKFYGDFFSKEKVPLKTQDLKELISYWMRHVNFNHNRIQKSYQVLCKHFNQDKILEYYSNVYDRPKFNANDLKNLLKI